MNELGPIGWTAESPRRGGRGIFLDRDGVLNRAFVRDGKPYPPAGVGDFELLPGVEAACATLGGAGFSLVVVTNQPDIARGVQGWDVHAALLDLLRNSLPLDAVYVCPHDDADGCPCRKPKPGMIYRGQLDLELDLAGSWMVGDRWRDIAAGEAAGCRTVFLDYHYSERRPADPTAVCSDLSEAAALILNNFDEGADHDRRHATEDQGLR